VNSKASVFSKLAIDDPLHWHKLSVAYKKSSTQCLFEAKKGQEDEPKIEYKDSADARG